MVRQDEDWLTMTFETTGARLRLTPWDGATYSYALEPVGPFGPLAELDYLTRGLAEFSEDGVTTFERLRLITPDHQTFEFGRE